MDMELKKRFMELWNRYFGGADLPIVFYYADEPADTAVVKAPSGRRCMLADIAAVYARRHWTRAQGGIDLL